MKHVSLVGERAGALKLVPLALAASACLAPDARAQSQVVFGIDYRGGTIATPDTATVVPITEADLLRAPFLAPTFGPMPAPQLTFNGAQLGLAGYSVCVGHPAGIACGIETDAFSFGNDAPFNNLLPPGAPNRARIFFSVDRYARGIPGAGLAPSVFSEGALGANEAAADVFTIVGTIAGPLPLPVVPGQSIGMFDGNGLPNVMGKRYRGLGLREPPQGGPFDDLDSLAIAQVPTAANAVIYFSLDGALVDPLTLQAGSNSAALNGVFPSAVLQRNVAGGPITTYANSALLGLHPTLDDLDALLLTENGDGVYQPSIVFYDWLTGATDMLLFSVRRGSAIIGVADSLFGIPIEPGDILAPPATPGSAPRMFIPAERLGLRTERGAMTAFGDELDALGSSREPYIDCNMNGRDDAEDIAVGYSSDTNANGIPDECEQSYTRYCYCPAPLGPCGNDDATAGCKNNTGLGGLLCGFGTTSVATDDLEMLATQLPPFSIGLIFMGPAQTLAPFGDGLRCVGPTIHRLAIAPADLLGNANFGPGFVALSQSIGGAAQISSGSTFNFQVWYRDAATYCMPETFNLTNGLSVVFTP
ncbi:MAG: hypothetical protein JNL28_11135 [Planctomycetes bacterium]|nr:hypothetical protein [Planctomycetota bacterium]